MQISTNSECRGATLTKALFIYRDTHVAPPALLVTSYDTNDVGELRNGRFLSSRDVRSLGKSLYEELSANSGHHLGPCIPDPEIIAYSEDFLCFEIPAHSRKLFMEEAFGEIRHQSIPLPRTLVVLHGSSAFMFAVKAKGRITGKTPLYVSPIPGAGKSGLVHSCGVVFPSNRFDPSTWRASAEALLDARKSFHFASGITKSPFVDAARMAVEADRFPPSELIPRNQALGAFVSGLS